MIFCYRFLFILLTVSSLFLLNGCSSTARTPLPEAEHLDTRILGYSNLRHWGDESNTDPLSEYNIAGNTSADYDGIMHREHNYLVISGGGARGAYGAGLLVGWTETGNRPEFTVVTGVSTGALTAPFAFLGSDYDKQLEEVYTTLDTKSIFKRRSLFNVFGGEALLDTSPLKRVINKHIDSDMIEALAREYQRGRQLIIGTTNLDAERPVAWNITRIAATGHPGAPALVRKILLASASLPGAFPPVYFEVESASGEIFDEMHVDGGVTSQMFFYPSDMDWAQLSERLDIKGTPTLYVLRNSSLKVKYHTVKPRVSAIAAKTVSSLVRTQGIGDFYRMGLLAERDGLDMKVTWIPLDAVSIVKPKELFDPEYMKQLFTYGYQRMLDGEAWIDSHESLME